ncbi:MAG: hypothetical protein ACO4CZ_05125, partial [Planctomycetota bacterium]
MTNPTMLCRTLAALAATSALLSAQRGLREIPDPSVQAQLDGFTVAAGARLPLFAAAPLIQQPLYLAAHVRRRHRPLVAGGLKTISDQAGRDAGGSTPAAGSAPCP